jgi:hypothetical protein
MPEQIEKDGKKFWRFPKLPFDVGQQTRAIYNYYMRTNPETGELIQTEWATHPNNSTPATLGPLLRMLRRITDQNAAALAPKPIFGDIGRLKDDQAKWEERLAFYEAKVAELVQIDPDVPVGTPGSDVAQQLGALVVEPLFLGWYPNEILPFSGQGSPYAGQVGQSVMDLYMPYTIANQVAITEAALAENYELFKQDLKYNAKRFFTETLPNLPGLNVRPYVIAAALGFGIYSWVKR